MSHFTVKNSSLGLTVAAFALCLGGIFSLYRVDDKTKPLALNIAVGAGAIAIGSLASANICEQEVKNEADKLVQQHTTQLKLIEQDRDNLGQKLNKQTSALNEVKILNDKQEQTILQTSTELQIKNSLVAALQAELIKVRKEVDSKLSQDDNRYETTVYLLKCGFQASLQEKIEESYERLADSISSNLSNENYQGIHPQLQHLYDSLAVRRDNHYLLHNQIAYIEDDIAGNLTDIYFQITDEIAALKVRYRNILNIDERAMLDMASQELIERRDLKKFIPTPKVMTKLKDYEQHANGELSKIKHIANQNSQELQELKDEVNSFISQLEEKHNEIAKLQQEIAALNKPLTWRLAQGSNPLTKGNIIINYFWGKGIRLDRAFISGDNFESKIYFHADNNPRTLIFKELNEHSEALQQICFTHKPVTFDWDAEKGLMVASLVWQLKTKEQVDELSDEAINRIARSWETWKKHAKKWNRIRITGGSGAGKSPLTERIVSEQLRHKKVKSLSVTKLYNPQAGSRKDNWSFASIGKTHQDSIKGVAELTKLCSQKYQGDFGIWIFDEVDSTLRQAPGKKRPTADEPEPEPTMASNMLSIITQIDHTTQAVFYLGQGANTGKIPNTTKGDWNNLVAIHINGNAQDYLRLAEHIDKDTQIKLIQQAELLQKYCNRKNSELGLDRVEPGAYRYALIDEYGEKQYYVLLPLFSADEFLDSLSVDVPATVVVHKAVEVESIKCPDCGSVELSKNGKDGLKQRYICKSCGKNFKI